MPWLMGPQVSTESSLRIKHPKKGMQGYFEVACQHLNSKHRQEEEKIRYHKEEIFLAPDDKEMETESGWVFLYEKGYQSKDSIINSVSVKLKGIALTNVSGMGIMTGKCVNFTRTQKSCEIFGWCPVEIDDNIPKRNLVEQVTERYLKKCVYHKDKDPLCPVFKLGHMVEESGQNFSQLAFKGGTVGITINWDCDLDWPQKYCVPVYKFHKLYNEDSNVSPGYNFRYARYYRENGRDMRILYKVFGIRFDILVNGKAGKFDIIPTMTTIGSGIGIFGVASVLCDLLLLNFLSDRDYYKQKKFKYVERNCINSEKEDIDMSNSQGKEKSSL
ncbi:hypothetical protein Chor_005953 [Crotalus horridus]